MSKALPSLPEEQFKHVIASTPLVSIDLIVLHKQQVLLGKRINRPAQGFWFVPGGRICKNEPLAEAFLRLTQVELGLALDYSQAKLLGAFDHFYSDSVFGEAPSTHYVALGLLVEVPKSLDELPKDQHAAFAWWSISDALSSSDVHQHTKDYLYTLLKD